MNTEKCSLRVLKECAKIQEAKSSDYQNSQSRIKQADHYPRGCSTIIDMAYQKMIRIYSLLDAAEKGCDEPNFESIEDSAKDAINYLSFFVAYSRGEMDGQDRSRDIFNRAMDVPVPNDECKTNPCVNDIWPGATWPEDSIYIDRNFV